MKSTPQNLRVAGESFDLVKKQRQDISAVYKGKDSYLRIGSSEKISVDLARHKEMEAAGFPVPKLLSEGDLEGLAYFTESSMGERSLGQLFAEDFEKTGSISPERFDDFLRVTEQFARAQLGARIAEKDFEVFTRGVHVETLCEELPDYAAKIRSKFAEIQAHTSELPFVITHGDFNPHNLYPNGVIDLEDSYCAPFGLDIVGSFFHIDYFPDSQDFEFFAQYRFSEEQRRQYFDLLDLICREENVPLLSQFQEDFEFTRAIWLLVKMQGYPEIQQFRYKKFLNKFCDREV